MKRATTISVQLISFDTLQTPGESNVENCKGLLFYNVGADTRAAAMLPASHQAFKFLILGFHENESSANYFIDNNKTIFPWLDESNEIWRAVLQPYHHKGEANYLDPKNPAKLFDELVKSPGSNAPVVVLTTAGFVTGESLDMNRVMKFSEGTGAVRVSMTALDGLHSQQSFVFPGVLTNDFMSVTLWRDSASVGKFAYGSSIHKMLIEKQHTQNMADRTSFTRCKIIRSDGTWHGTDPTKWNQN